MSDHGHGHAPKASSHSSGGGSNLVPNGVIIPGLCTGIAIAILTILVG